MSEDHVASDASSSSRPSRTAVQTLREALQLFWSVADGYAKRRLLLALALVAAGALLAALTPNAVRLVVDSSRYAAELPPPTALVDCSRAGAMTARFGQRRAPAPTRMAVAAARPALEYSSSSDSSSTSTSSSHRGSDTCS